MAESHSVKLLFLLIGYLVLSTTVIWFIVSGASGQSVNYMKLSAFSYSNTTTSVNFTQAQPSDLYVTGAPGAFLGIGPKFIWNQNVGMIAKPYPFFPAYLELKGLIPETNGYITNTYQINNSISKPFGIIITAPPGWNFANIQYLDFDHNVIKMVPETGSTFNGYTSENLSKYQYSTGATDYLSEQNIQVNTQFNPVNGDLIVSVDGNELFDWPADNTDTEFHGGIIGFDDGMTLTGISQMRSIISYDPQTDVLGNSLNYAVFIMSLATFSAPVTLFPPPLASLLIPALFFYLPIIGILACIVSIIWPVV